MGYDAMFPFKWRLIVQYLAACRASGEEPTWEGADAFRTKIKEAQGYENRAINNGTGDGIRPPKPQ
jgi:hypothetical protein